MRKISAQEFVRRFKESTIGTDSDSRFTFFLGAGCSVSSGIPTARSLVNDSWLHRLKVIRTGNDNDLDKWIKETYPSYKPKNAASFYGDIIEALFLTADERQKEIERLVEGKDPGFGYAVLAQLISDKNAGRHCNVILTTNFDDLVADALYLYSNKKPLVIPHESLTSFVRISRTRPLILKLHGDARLAPKNTDAETSELSEAFCKTMRSLLTETGLIFIGYGGNDKSIANVLKSLDSNALPWGIYWFGKRIPKNKLGKWLDERNAILVDHVDFDEVMLLIRNEFELKHPDRKRFDTLLENYQESFMKLGNKIQARPENKEKKVLREAVKKAADDWYALYFEAEKNEKSNPEKANAIYTEAIERFANEPLLLGSYANFLYSIYKDYDKAEQYYKKTVELNPNQSGNLGNYALFLEKIRNDYDKAEQYYCKSLEINSNSIYQLGNYAAFLTDIRKDYDKAEEFYKKAIEVAPKNAINLVNYANLLNNIRKDYNKAEEFYKKGVKAEPNNATHLGNYAFFLKGIRKDYDKAEEFYKKAIEADPIHANNLASYATFLTDIRKDYNKAEKFYKKTIEVKPNDAFRLGNYALFLYDIRKDYDKAEEFYKKAIEADPNHANNLGNYVKLLIETEQDEKAKNYIEKAFKANKKEQEYALELELWFYCYAVFWNEYPLAKEKTQELLNKGIKSSEWNLKEIVRISKQKNHPEPELVEKFAKDISEIE